MDAKDGGDGIRLPTLPDYICGPPTRHRAEGMSAPLPKLSDATKMKVEDGVGCHLQGWQTKTNKATTHFHLGGETTYKQQVGVGIAIVQYHAARV